MSLHKLGFVHIPKTGGTSISSMLYVRYRWPCEDIHKFSNEFEGRIPLFTFVRDPIHRAYSYMQMAYRNGDNPFHKFYRSCEHERSIVQTCHCVDSFLDGCYEVNNAMCQQIESPKIARPWETSTVQSALYRGRQKGGPKEISNLVYQRAIEKLNNFFYVGIFEDFDAHVATFFDKIDLYFEPEIKSTKIQHANKSEYPPIEPELAEKLRERNQYDIKLYEYVKENHQRINTKEWK